MAEPVPSMFHHQLRPSEQRLDLALKVCWDCNSSIPCCKRKNKSYKVNLVYGSFLSLKYNIFQKFARNENLHNNEGQEIVTMLSRDVGGGEETYFHPVGVGGSIKRLVKLQISTET